MTNRGISDLIEAYRCAWENQDAELIATVFAEDATYQEGPFSEPMIGRTAIRTYWNNKVVKQQANITCRVLRTMHVNEDLAVVEWLATFDDLETGGRREMQEIAIIEHHGGHIVSLREYWKSRVLHRLT